MLHALLLIGHIDGGGDARGQSTQNRMAAGPEEDTDGGEQHIVDCIACLLRTQHAGIIISEHCCSLLVLAQRLLLGRCSNPRTPSHCVYIEELIQIDQAGERSRSKTLKHITSVSPIRAVEVPFTSSWRLHRVQHTLGDMCVTGERGSHEVLSAKGEGMEHDPSGCTFPTTSSIGSRFCGGCRWILVSGFMLSSKSNSSSPSDSVVVVFSSFAYKKRQSHSLSVCLLKGLSCSSSLPLSAADNNNNIHHLPRFVSQTGFALFSVINLN